MMLRAVLFVLLSVVGGLAAPGVPAGADATRCGAVVTTSTVLTSDLLCPGNGLSIGADGITLDLGGHTISGPGADKSIGILNSGFDKVSIVNGTVTGFESGVSLRRTIGNVIRLNAHANDAYGIVLNGSHDGVIYGSVLTGNGSQHGAQTGAGLALINSHRNHLEENYLLNRGDGLRLSGSDGNTVQESRTGGIGSEGNARAGIVLVNSKDNRLFSNEAAGNGLAGIHMDTASTGNSLAGNNAVGNAGIGIDAEGGEVTDGGGNRASDNRGPVQCRNVTCS